MRNLLSAILILLLTDTLYIYTPYPNTIERYRDFKSSSWCIGYIDTLGTTKYIIYPNYQTVKIIYKKRK